MLKRLAAICLFAVAPISAHSQQAKPRALQAPPRARRINLPSSKQLLPPVLGNPQKINSLPMAMVVSPDGRYAVTLNAGYGTAVSQYRQSFSVLDLAGNAAVNDVPEQRTPLHAKQTLYQGLAFSRDGKHLYASLASITDPTGKATGSTGNAIAVYGFANGHIAPESLLPIPLQHLAAGKRQNPLNETLAPGEAIPFPAGLCVVGEGATERLLVADNLSDDALLMETATGKILTRFDLSFAQSVPASFPIWVVATRNGARAFVALWNRSSVVELDLVSGKVTGELPLMRPGSATAPGSHPAAMVLSPDERTLYVALANGDAIAQLDIASPTLQLARLLPTALPGQKLFGGVPNAVAISPDAHRLYVANASSNSIAVFDLKSQSQPAKPLGFIPTEWYPTALAVEGNSLLIATAKGKGTGPNNFPQEIEGAKKSSSYIASILSGSLARVDRIAAERNIASLTAQALESNHQRAVHQGIVFATGGHPIRHVIYIIKENRTYDQIFGDIPGANGDPSLTMYGRDITPNQHKLAEQFGVLDNFYDSGEVSGNGHVWSNAAITTDYTEKTWQQAYRGNERSYDFEGMVAEGYPLLQGIADVNEPASGYLWTNLAAHGKTLYHFGEFVSSKFCDEKGEQAEQAMPQEGTPEPTTACAHNSILTGDPIPQNYGGGTSKYPWAIPLLAGNTATKPELVNHFDPLYPDFNVDFPDQLRVDEFLTQFNQWSASRSHGKDEMPDFVMLRLPNDHTGGTRPGGPTPRASVADNDLAVGRAVDAISHSAYWNDTAFFILEDDAQAGADHVDAHRSIALVISKYSPRSTTQKPYVNHTFYTTVSTIATMEALLGLPPMNNNDATAPLIAPLFQGVGSQPAFSADYANRDNLLIFQSNSKKAPGAGASVKMDFRHADQADTAKLNVILWRDAMGRKPLPASLRHPAKTRRDDDD